MPTLPKGKLGPITAMEIAKRHGLTKPQVEEIAMSAGVDIHKWEFTYMCRSDARRFLAELYRRKGARVLARRAAAKGDS